MTRSIHTARLALALLLGTLSGSCTNTPTTPTPPVVPVAAPVISCPESQNLPSPLGTPIAVVYSSPSVVGGASPITTTCTPASGTTFPIGSTTVTCTATDAQQRTSTCSLTVSVAAPPRLRVTKFVAFGDSITDGQDGQNAVTSDVAGVLTFLRSVILFGREYPTVLKASLQARYSLQVDAITVLNQGNPGEAAGDAATFTRFTSAISGSSAVLLMEGSNDVYYGFRDSLVTDAGLAGLQRMVRAAKSAGVVPFLATIPPMNASACTPMCRGVGASIVPAFDDRIRQLAASENVTLVDVYKGFNGDLTLLSPDGLHPNAAGYARIADTFLQSIKETLELAPTVSGASGRVPVPLTRR